MKTEAEVQAMLIKQATNDAMMVFSGVRGNRSDLSQEAAATLALAIISRMKHISDALS